MEGGEVPALNMGETVEEGVADAEWTAFARPRVTGMGTGAQRGKGRWSSFAWLPETRPRQDAPEPYLWSRIAARFLPSRPA